MKKYLRMLSIMLVFLIAVSGTAIAKKGKCRHRRSKGWSMMLYMLKSPRMLKKIGLSQAKADKISAIIIQNRKYTIPIVAQMKVLGIDMKQAFQKSTIDKGRLMSIYRKMHTLRWKVKSTALKAKITIMNMLTKKQRAKVKKYSRRRFRRFKRRWGRKHRRK